MVLDKQQQPDVKQAIKVLVAASLFQLFLGVIYIWGIFVLPVSQAFEWDISTVQLTSSFKIGFFVLGNFTGGKLQTRLPAHHVSMLGGLLLSGGVLAAALLPPTYPWLFYLSYGIVGGLGAGMGYIVAITAAQRWFPTKRGLATGICVGAFGLSVTLLAPVLTWLLGFRTVQETFMIMSATFFLASLLFGRLVTFPESTSGATTASVFVGEQYTTTQILAKKEFYCLLCSLLLVTVGFFVINPSVQTLSMARGFDVSFATVLLMITGISNTLGRIIVPTLADKFKNETIMMILFGILGFAALMLTFAEGVLFVVMVALIPICFGAGLATIPLLVSNYFGMQNFGANYSAVGVGFATSALFMPGLLGMLGDYSTRFIAVSILSLLGILAMLPLRMSANKG